MQAPGKAKDNMCKYYDQHHQLQSDYEEGDEVLQNVKNTWMV
jgi:hypothetical protein